MAEWRDEAIILSTRPLGETMAVVTVLTRTLGRQSGLVKSARSAAMRGTLLPGNLVQASWHARLSDQLGMLKCESLDAYAARVLDDPARLTALSAACALCELTLPEHQPHGGIFGAFAALLQSLASDAWPSVYVHWELALLRGLGYGLDLTACAATGVNDGLAYVSPKTGRAVSLSAGEAYRDKLLPLPGFLLSGAEGMPGDVADGLCLTGFFLDRHVLAPHGHQMPPARTRLLDRLGAMTTISGKFQDTIGRR
jgi:DNA repair protein RecO (recombination protein O)